jgi:hypothetical protein
MITCAVPRYGFVHRTHSPPEVCRPYLAIVDSVARCVVFRILGFPRRYKHIIKVIAPCVRSPFPWSFGGLNMPSLALDFEPAHYASFEATLASLISDCDSKSLSPFYGTIRHELQNVATSPLPWKVLPRASFATI